MTNEVTALVVEDDLDMRDEIEDGLAVLGHGHHWAQSQQEAYELIQRTHYDYVLVDLEIPARTGRGFAKIEYGKKLISQIQRAKGRGRVPVVVMTAHHMHGLNLARELLIHGAMEFLSKPFGDVGNGKSLPETVQNVLDAHRKLFPRGALPGDPPEQFRGGTLAFYPDHIELAGEAILEEDGPGHAW
ncbi:MAG: response regulator, partial [Phycisphaerae bacterium]|nr:response regulator [Phycisphaerae bacterium]